MKPKLILLASVLIVGLVGTLTYLNQPVETGTTTVDIAYQPIVFGMPVFVGIEEGIFESENVEVEPHVFTSANDMISALVAGRVDIVPGAPLVPVISLESKYPGRFRIFAHSEMTSDQAFDRIIVKNDSPIRTVSDLIGKKLAQIPGTTAMNSARAYMKKANVDPDEINFVQLAPPAQLAAIASDSVDALYAYEPNLTIALASGEYRAITDSLYCSLLEPCPLVVAIVDREFEKEHPLEAKAAIRSILKAHEFMKESPEKASLALIPYTKISAELAPKVSLQNMTSGEMNTESLQKFIDILIEIGEIKKSIPVENLIKSSE